MLKAMLGLDTRRAMVRELRVPAVDAGEIKGGGGGERAGRRRGAVVVKVHRLLLEGGGEARGQGTTRASTAYKLRGWRSHCYQVVVGPETAGEHARLAAAGVRRAILVRKGRVVAKVGGCGREGE